jgi:hypothetical protein
MMAKSLQCAKARENSGTYTPFSGGCDHTVDNTTDEGVDVVDMLIQLLVRQVSALVEETAYELAKYSGGDEATIYRALAENCATKDA